MRRVFRRAFQSRPVLNVWQWADKYRQLAKENSAEPGQWDTARVPWLYDILETLSDPTVSKAVIRKSAQVGYTEGVLNNLVGFFIHQRPSPIIVVQPSNDDADDYAKDKLQSMIDATPVLASRLRDVPVRGKGGNTVTSKRFSGGFLKVVGAFSPRNLRRTSARVVLIDEVDGLPQSAGSEGSPIDIIDKRQTTFWDALQVLGSTPTIKGSSEIDRQFAASDQRHMYMPCPHCGHMQVLKWGGKDSPFGIKFEYTVIGGSRVVVPGSVGYLCEATGCGALIEEREKYRMLAKREWRAHNPGHPVPGWQLSSLFSTFPRVAWANLAQEWLNAQGDPLKLRVFVNTRLGESWEENAAEVKPESLADRAESYVAPDRSRIEAPMGVGVLTAFVDVQKDRLELLIRGWGAREESWMIAHHRIYGDTLQPEVWQQLEALWSREYTHESGAKMRIRAMGVDSGDGQRKNEIYDWVRSRQLSGVFATKGQSARQQEPVKVAKRKDNSGIKRLDIGTHPMKSTVFRRLALRLEEGKETPKGYMHFRGPDPDWHNGADAEYYAQFGREYPKRKQMPNGGWITEWVQKGANEALDLEVGVLAMLHHLGPSVRDNLALLAAGMKKEGERVRAESPVPAAPVQQHTRRPPPPRRPGGGGGGWVSGWKR